MALLFSNEILTAMDEELRSACESVQIISAYCKLDSIKKLSKEISPKVTEKKIMLRFRLDDLIKGSTDFEALEFCIKEGWKAYIRFDLHAKTYIVDNKRGIVGSANVTNSGLTGSGNNNFEMATLVDIEERDRRKIEKLYTEAIYVDRILLDKLRKQYELADKSDGQKVLEWDGEINDLFCPRIDSLFSYELPEKAEYYVGEYIQFLDMEFEGNKTNIKERFRWSNVYIWLLNVLEKKNGEIYFGELSAELHNALVEDPKPYRKDVKILLANMLTLIDTWQMDEIVVDRPNYSQRVRLLEKRR